ncbi:SMI1/KNR4 family protein [Streptomyces sp. NPDC058378]|uniref:SMI1/KNR4 family protein n=1 Tax=unclassified Streptomyces TaxID=2593676 RepID=UPI003651A93A
MNAHIQRLIRLVAPPQGVARSREWGDVTRELGIGLPSDYRELIDTYGGGCFDSYLWLLEPDCPKRPYDLSSSIEERDEGFEMLWEEGEQKPAQLLQAPESRLIPWASTDNGEFIYWLASTGTHPNGWTVMVNEARGAWWEHFEVGCADFLVSLLSGEIRSEILSTSFPLPDHDFRSFASF